MKLSTIIDALISADATREQIAAVVRAYEAECGSREDEKRAKERDRKRAQRAVATGAVDGLSRPVPGTDDLSPVVPGTSRDIGGQETEIQPSRADIITTRAPALIPVGLSNDNPPLSSPLPSEDPQPKRKSGTALPDDWAPPAELFAFGAKYGFSHDQTASILEDMQLWAQANQNRAIARKSNWIATAKGFIKREAARARQRAGPSGQYGASRGGFGVLMAKLMEKREDGRQTGNPNKNVPSLPYVGDRAGGSGNHDDGDVSGNDVGLFVGSSFRRM